MMKIVTIGSMVLCHLIAPNTTVDQTQPKIMKVLGEVVSIQKGPLYIEKVKDKETLAAKKDFLVIKGQNIPGTYQVSSTACMLVREETVQEEQDRKFIRKKKEEVVSDEKLNKLKVISETEEVVPEPEEVPAVEEVKKTPIKVEEAPKVEEKVEIAPALEKADKMEEKSKEKAPEAGKKDKSILDYIVN